jgi:hypothetical protein
MWSLNIIVPVKAMSREMSTTNSYFQKSYYNLLILLQLLK